jgi:putative sterol carrier protein
MAERPSFGVEEITPEQFAQMVGAASDDQILDGIRTGGTKIVLDRIFRGMQERFVPEKAQGVDAVIQFVVTDQGQEHPYAATVRDGACSVENTSADSPKVTLAIDLVSFARLTAGQAQGTQLFMTGKLKIAGDLVFATRVTSFFEPPEA